MADNVTYSTAAGGVPSGTIQVTDVNASTHHMPVFKLAVSADASTTLVPSSSVGGFVVTQGGYAASAEPAAGTTGVWVQELFDLVGRPVMVPHALPDLSVMLYVTSTATSVTLSTARAAGVRVYLTSLQIVNSSTTFTVVRLADSSTTRLAIPVPGSGGVVTTFPVPVQFTAASTVTANIDTGVTTLTISAQGYTGR